MKYLKDKAIRIVLEEDNEERTQKLETILKELENNSTTFLTAPKKGFGFEST